MRDAFAWKWKLSARDCASGLLLITPAPSAALFPLQLPPSSLSLCALPHAPWTGCNCRQVQQLQPPAWLSYALSLALTHTDCCHLSLALSFSHTLSVCPAPAQRGRTPRSMAWSGVQLGIVASDGACFTPPERTLFLSLPLSLPSSVSFSLLLWMPCASCNLWLVATSSASAKKRKPQPQWVEKSEHNLGKTVGA